MEMKKVFNSYWKIFLTILLLVHLSGCNPNLLGQTRFTVEGQVYSLAAVEEFLPGQEGSVVRIWLSRVGVPTQESDANIISKVSGIVIVNPESVSIGIAEVIYDGNVRISFETTGQSGPWTLLWPDHEPVLITN
ncbi:MAG: hypothetical protein JW870_20740 [Candidatus Delongbacteria bacterium]|nr:hypothetical protein [Candidatus Delongbacteria bacterium]